MSHEDWELQQRLRLLGVVAEGEGQYDTKRIELTGVGAVVPNTRFCRNSNCSKSEDGWNGDLTKVPSLGVDGPSLLKANACLLSRPSSRTLDWASVPEWPLN
jgi:hypothetical protein